MKEIGLKRGTVRLVPYNPKWPKLFLNEEKAIRLQLGDEVTDIQHVGSTAIPGMQAKPIIDIAIPVADLSIADKWTKPLAEIGYHYRGKKPLPDRVFFAKGPDYSRIVYLHLLTHKAFEKQLRFRDALIHDKNLTVRYSDLKQELANKYLDDRESYTEKKSKFIEEVLCNLNV